MRQATAAEQADHNHDLRKHEPRPSDYHLTVEQRFAVAELIGYAEGIVSAGILTIEAETSLRLRIARALAAFGLPSKTERQLNET